MEKFGNIPQRDCKVELTSGLGDPWGYRRLTTYSGYAAEDDAAHGPPERPWLAGGVTITGRLGTA